MFFIDLKINIILKINKISKLFVHYRQKKFSKVNFSTIFFPTLPILNVDVYSVV